jgi:guanine nucleotide-binding protein subunit alpha
MCFGGGDKDEPGAARNREIEKLIRQDEKRASREVKLLLLGAGESGKSTVLKQMRLIYAQGFSKSEKEEWRAIIFNNILSAFKVIIDAMDELDIEFEFDNNDKHLPTILLEKDLGPKDPMPMEYLTPFKDLWRDAGVQQTIERGNEFALHDNLSYFFENVDRLFAKDFVPTDQDVLRSRLRTTGITETIFDLGSLTYRMFDVGGQRSERKKWIHCFENVNCLLFLVAISGYDQCLVEDKDGNQMQEALMLWESIANSQWFTKSALILFLNKMDLFKEKLASSPITKHGFADFQGDPSDWKEASKYFMDKFRALNRNPAKEIYGHFTNATDTNLLKITMGSVQDMIIQRNLNKLIL